MVGTAQLYGGKDPREIPVYTVGEAAHYLRLPRGTLLHWVDGQPYRAEDGSKKRRPRVIKPARLKPPTLSFWNLVEAFVLASIRRQHGVTMQKVRKALKFVESELAMERPLIHGNFETDGVDLFVREFGKILNVSRDGQLELKDMMVASLKRVDHDPQGLASKLFPWAREPNEPTEVELDPGLAFGKLVVRGTGIPTSVIADRLRSGDSLEHLARDYRLSMDQVSSALRWELPPGR